MLQGVYKIHLIRLPLALPANPQHPPPARPWIPTLQALCPSFCPQARQAWLLSGALSLLPFLPFAIPLDLGMAAPSYYEDLNSHL